MKLAIIIITIITGLVHLHGQTVIFSNSTYSSPIPFQSNIDTLIVHNCTFQNFSGEAIRFENVHYVEVTKSTFTNITNTISTRAVICGKKSNRVILKNLYFNSIGGTAIRFPTDGETSALKRLTHVVIDSVNINGTLDPGAFEANGIRVFHTDTLLVRNCTIKNITDNAINIGRNSSGQTQVNQRINYCEIHHNFIDSILGNGILAVENAGRALVHHNVISNIAFDGTGMLPTEGDHGMYWQAPGALIYENSVLNVLDGQTSGNTGNGISLRTNARVYRNEVGHCTRNGIGYWNDHPGSGLLDVTNNLVYNTENNGIYINGSGPNPEKPDTVLLLHNTVHTTYNSGVIHQSSPVALNDLAGYNYVAGNMLLFENITDTAEYIRFFGTIPSQNVSHNFYAAVHAGFVHIDSRDYHLTALSPAINTVPATITNVLIDKDNNPRTQHYDAGCYEYFTILAWITLTIQTLNVSPIRATGYSIILSQKTQK